MVKGDSVAAPGIRSREASERGFKLLQKPVVPETLREAIVAELAAD